MKNQNDTMHMGVTKRRIKRFNSPGYPSYPTSDDIYNKFLEEKEVNPEEITKIKDPKDMEKIKALRAKYILDEMCGNYLDIPEGELDDEQ
jgi:hypothetical protein